MSGRSVDSVKLCIGGCQFTFFRFSGGMHGGNGIAISHCHLHYEIFLVREGMCVFRLKQKNVTLRCGEMLIIEPEHFHFAYDGFDDNCGACVNTISLIMERVGEDDDVYDRFRTMFHQYAERPVTFLPELSECVRSFGNPSDGSIASLCAEKINMCRIIDLLAESCGDAPNTDRHIPSQTDPNEARMLLDCLIYDSDITVEQIADTLHYSPKQVSRLIFRTYGLTLCQIRSERRFETALKLLGECGGLSVGEIAHKAGYGTVSSFYRSFREHTGMTPEAFRHPDKDRT